MITRRLTKGDFDDIIQVIDRWWGRDVPVGLDPTFYYELGGLGRVVVEETMVVGFLFGFVAGDEGVVHLVGCHPDHRRRGIGSVLCDTFEEECRAALCSSLKTVLPCNDQVGRAFYAARGWTGECVDDYAGPGRARWIGRKPLETPL